MIDVALSALRNMGYHIYIKKSKVTIDRTNGYLVSYTVDAAVYAGQAHLNLNKPRLAKQFGGFAKETYLVLYGELRGFTQRYGDYLD